MVKSNKLPLIVGAAVIVLVAAGTILVRRSSDLPVAPDTDVVATGPVAGAEPERQPRPAGATASPAAGPERLERAQERRNQMREEYIARTAELKKNAADTFERETVDPAWAPQKETDLKAIADAPGFETAGVAPQDLAIECKSSMCRVDGRFASNGEAEDWLLIYMSSVGGNMPNAVVSRSRNPDGSTRVQIYGRGR